MDIRNISPLGDLIIPALGIDVAADAVFSVNDQAIAASLLEQSENFIAANEKTPKSPAATVPTVPADPAPAA